MTRLSRTDAMLSDQHDRLSAVIRSDAPPEVKSLAGRYLAKVQYWQRHHAEARVMALSELGPNQYGPAIDDVCAQAEFHARQSAPKRRRAA